MYNKIGKLLDEAYLSLPVVGECSHELACDRVLVV